MTRKMNLLKTGLFLMLLSLIMTSCKSDAKKDAGDQEEITRIDSSEFTPEGEIGLKFLEIQMANLRYIELAEKSGDKEIVEVFKPAHKRFTSIADKTNEVLKDFRSDSKKERVQSQTRRVTLKNENAATDNKYFERASVESREIENKLLSLPEKEFDQNYLKIMIDKNLRDIEIIKSELHQKVGENELRNLMEAYIELAMRSAEMSKKTLDSKIQ